MIKVVCRIVPGACSGDNFQTSQSSGFVSEWPPSIAHQLLMRTFHTAIIIIIWLRPCVAGSCRKAGRTRTPGNVRRLSSESRRHASPTVVVVVVFVVRKCVRVICNRGDGNDDDGRLTMRWRDDDCVESMMISRCYMIMSVRECEWYNNAYERVEKNTHALRVLGASTKSLLECGCFVRAGVVIHQIITSKCARTMRSSIFMRTRMR